jgi:hypothetical protein
MPASCICFSLLLDSADHEEASILIGIVRDSCRDSRAFCRIKRPTYPSPVFKNSAAFPFQKKKILGVAARIVTRSMGRAQLSHVL